MLSVKIILLAVLSFIAGAAFFIAGFYFLSAGFLDKLNESAPQKTAEIFAKNKIRAKGSAYISLGTGALTIMWAVMLLLFPSIAPVLGLIYMIFLMIACLVLIVLFK